VNLNLNDLMPGCKNFTWNEFLYLPSWDIYVYPDQTQYENLIQTGKMMQMIRNSLGKPITISSGLRPRFYNRLVGGAKESKHILGLAADWYISGVDCDQVRLSLVTKLEAMQIRMEDLMGSDWIHTDWAPGEVGNRFFKP